ncbi:MAG: ABC transporter ATP-binding protein/permease [candidate division Zixibacteria bacterium]|nr:ABC transporter ATP-binding protein/permease [candidate division Zixibacteria bacterium]MDH3938972.1 ABC transporter ATP-binding protein/permease [candidate division Zixibacteria bacterium]MDH4035556.1 ABC transporter ATP-binding protein/permease [candidate division Zixibacteria bacterium]
MSEHNKETTTDLFSTVTKHLKRYRFYLISGGVCIIASNLLLLLLPYITKIVFDLLEQQGTDRERLNWVLILIALAFLSGLFRFLTRRTVIWMSRRVEYDLRGEVFRHLLTLSPSYYDKTRTGDIMARMTSDLEAIRMMVGPGIMHFTSTIVTFVIALSFMVYLSPRLTLYSLVPMVLFPLVANRVGNLVHRRAMRIQDHFSVLTASVQENIAGIRVVKAYRQEENETEHFAGLSRQYLDLNMDMARLYAAMVPILFLLASLLMLSALYFGGLEVMNDVVPLGTLVAFFAYLSMLIWPAVALGWVVSLYQRGKASLQRINRILHTEPDIKQSADKLHAEKMRGHIAFRALDFKYNGTRVLRGIELTIEPGQTIGLVGRTGSGKTTLVSLLAHLYPIDRGQLFIDGVDINDWDLSALRRQIGFATQEPFLFSDSLGDNIRFGVTGATDESVEQAASTAALTKDVDTFADRFSTIIGERGITLSGGQKQRTAIARAILTDPAVLVLDDATSSVDTETEDEINQRISSVLAGRTSIIISHRVSSVKGADRILYLEDGRIVEQGPHEELIALGGRYHDLHRSQLLAEQLENL